LRSRLSGNSLQLVELALKPPRSGPEGLALRELWSALDLVSKLGEARFEAVGFLEFTNALGELAKTRIQVGNPLEIIDLTLQLLDVGQQERRLAQLSRERLCDSGLDRVQILERVLHTTGPEAWPSMKSALRHRLHGLNHWACDGTQPRSEMGAHAKGETRSFA
jgi:hypothetical protein